MHRVALRGERLQRVREKAGAIEGGDGKNQRAGHGWIAGVLQFKVRLRTAYAAYATSPLTVAGSHALFQRCFITVIVHSRLGSFPVP